MLTQAVPFWSTIPECVEWPGGKKRVNISDTNGGVLPRIRTSYLLKMDHRIYLLNQFSTLMICLDNQVYIFICFYRSNF